MRNLHSFYEKESHNVGIIPGGDSADDVQYITIDVILYTLYTGWQDNIYVHFCVQL
jgi:hypothetical protein